MREDTKHKCRSCCELAADVYTTVVSPWNTLFNELEHIRLDPSVAITCQFHLGSRLVDVSFGQSIQGVLMIIKRSEVSISSIKRIDTRSGRADQQYAEGCRQTCVVAM